MIYTKKCLGSLHFQLLTTFALYINGLGKNEVRFLAIGGHPKFTNDLIFGSSISLTDFVIKLLFIRQYANCMPIV